MPKSNLKSEFGWKWLRKHPRRHEIVEFVKSCGTAQPAVPPGVGLVSVTVRPPLPNWLQGDPSAAIIERDADVMFYRVGAKQGLHEVVATMREHGITISAEHVRNTVRVYSNYSDEMFVPAPKVDLRSRAREVLTPEVLLQHQLGQLKTSDIARLLGPKATSHHACYWIKRMRVIHDRRARNLTEYGGRK